jgi:hypothetical protein
VFRLHGPLIGSVLQAGVALVALWFVWDRRALLSRYRGHVVAAFAVATAIILGWHFVYQPVLAIPTPPPEFAMTIHSPSPFVFAGDQLTTVNLTVDVTGEARQLPEGHALWMLVREEGTATYSLGGQAEVQPDGRFLADDVIVGPAATRVTGDRRYPIQPVLVDRAGDAFLRRHSNEFWRFFHPMFVVRPEPRLQSALVIRR